MKTIVILVLVCGVASGRNLLRSFRSHSLPSLQYQQPAHESTIHHTNGVASLQISQPVVLPAEINSDPVPIQTLPIEINSSPAVSLPGQIHPEPAPIQTPVIHGQVAQSPSFIYQQPINGHQTTNGVFFRVDQQPQIAVLNTVDQPNSFGLHRADGNNELQVEAHQLVAEITSSGQTNLPQQVAQPQQVYEASLVGLSDQNQQVFSVVPDNQPEVTNVGVPLPQVEPDVPAPPPSFFGPQVEPKPEQFHEEETTLAPEILPAPGDLTKPVEKPEPRVTCADGYLADANGDCVEPEILRNIFLYAAPERPKIALRKRIFAPKPKLEYNIVFVRNPDEGHQAAPFIIPPPQQKTLVYVLNEKPRDAVENIIHTPVHPKLKPEVYFVNYDRDENPQLPGGIDLQTALREMVLEGSIIEEPTQQVIDTVAATIDEEQSAEPVAVDFIGEVIDEPQDLVAELPVVQDAVAEIPVTLDVAPQAPVILDEANTENAQIPQGYNYNQQPPTSFIS